MADHFPDVLMGESIIKIYVPGVSKDGHSGSILFGYHLGIGNFTDSTGVSRSISIVASGSNFVVNVEGLDVPIGQNQFFIRGEDILCAVAQGIEDKGLKFKEKAVA